MSGSLMEQLRQIRSQNRAAVDAATEAAKREEEVVEFTGILPPELNEPEEIERTELVEWSDSEDGSDDDSWDEEPLIDLAVGDSPDWRTLSWKDNGFSNRIVNAMDRSDIPNLGRIEGWTRAEVKNIRGISQTSLEEILEFLGGIDGVVVEDYILPRKSKKKAAAKSVPTPDPEIAVVRQNEDPVMHEVVVESAPVPEPEVVERSVGDLARQQIARAEQDAEESEPELESSIEVPRRDSRILVIGPVSVHGEGFSIIPMEQVYRESIEGICEAAGVRALSLIEYAKGWGALAAAIDDKGWPEGVHGIHIARSGRYEVIEVLSRMADLVIEAG